MKDGISVNIRIDENIIVDSMNRRSVCSVRYKWLLFYRLLTTMDVAEYCRVHHEITHNASGRGTVAANPKGF